MNTPEMQKIVDKVKEKFLEEKKKHLKQEEEYLNDKYGSIAVLVSLSTVLIFIGIFSWLNT